MSKHTPGPWMVFVSRPLDMGHTVYHVAEHTHSAIALGREFWDSNVPAEDADGYFQPDANADIPESKLANARLIAAAPELLEACEWAAQTIAAGAPNDGCEVSIHFMDAHDKLLAAIAKATGATQ